MVDVFNGQSLQSSGEGTPQNATNTGQLEGQAASEQSGQSGPKYVTQEDVLQLFETMFDRKAQSISQKTVNRVQRLLNTAQQNGVQLTPAQAQSLLETADLDHAEQNQPPTQQRQPAAQPQRQQEQPPASVPPVVLLAQEILRQEGVTLEDSDPETGQIPETSDPVEFLQAVRQAAAAKKERQKTSLPARMPTLTGGGKVTGAGGGKAAAVQELDRLLKEPTKNIARIRELREQLRNQ